MRFQEYEKLNVIRHGEENQTGDWADEIKQASNTLDKEIAHIAGSFKEKAVARASQLMSVTGIGQAYAKHQRKNRRLIFLFYAVFSALGFFSVMQTMDKAGSQVNVYWLLLLLIGVNLVSMLVWLFLVLRGRTGRAPTVSFYQTLLKRMSSVESAPLLTAWSDTHLRGRTGAWFLSKHAHAYWLMYLAGGLFALLLILTGKQIDFVWGTTILDATTFATITAWLGALPSQFGFAVPDQAMVFASVPGASSEALADSRATWANFVVGAILVYAVIPRLALLVFSSIAFFWAKHRYCPDWELPYFYALRSKLLPEGASLGVVDPDSEQKSVDTDLETTPSPQLMRIDQLALPEGAYVAAFEWGDSSPPNLNIESAIVLDKINDVHAQTGILQALKQTPKPTVLMVPLHRAADRGASRFLEELHSLAPIYLVVVQLERQPSDAARWAGWQAVAERVNIKSDQLALVSL